MSAAPFSYSLPARPIPLEGAWDVIVAGGGPAGCAAAAAAARDGAKTLLLEATGSLGGMGTSALVPAWTPFGDGERIVYRGIAGKVFEASKRGLPYSKQDDVNWVPIDPERLKRIYDELVTEAGAEVRFNTMLASVERKGEKIDALVVANKGGLTALRAKVYIDATGDADLCAWGGVPFHKGDAKGKKLMPATHCFSLSNVDIAALQQGPALHASNPESPIFAILKSGKYPLIPDAHICVSLIGPDTVGFNAGHLWDVDGTRPETVSRALVQGRRMAAQFRDALAEFFPAAFGNAFLANTGSLMGIRETRRIVGDYELTLDDYVARRAFDDEICRNAYFIDVHWAKDEIALNPEEHENWDANCLRYGKGESHGIPYRSLVPQGLENVLVAGRSISCEQIVQGSVRVMPVCLAMGEAAGAAAAEAARLREGRVRQVDVGALRERLRRAGAYLPPLPSEVESLAGAEVGAAV
ncbi:FAD-dependent oxidoreductase [Verrucomicrobium sp. GAS474]|uniref:FAD-dependent oxidoreductase n=1 Tax=Verrucomicrobium sp. GAS474 TaxID=1882831 RepID=UPI000B83B6DA|nr:FAD-dependent oxidoreductase [Verrucomicrobium sp. GAS474]